MSDSNKIGLAAEELVIAKRQVEGDTVKVRVETRFTEQLVELSGTREEISIETIEIGQEVTEAPRIRIEGNVTIIPVMEEQFVVVKRLILKQELHIATRRTEEVGVETVQLRSEHATVERIPPSATNPMEKTQ